MAGPPLRSATPHLAIEVSVFIRGSNSVNMVFEVFRGGVGPDIAEFGPLPGPTRPWGGLGKGPGPARFAPIRSPVDQV